MSKNILFPILIFTTLFSCKEENVDCSLVLCAAGDVINLELILNGENAIANGTYSEENIVVTGDEMENLQIRVFQNTQGASSGLLEISNIDWQAGSYNYNVQLENDREFNIQAQFTLSGSGPCCGNRRQIEELSSPDVTIEKPSNSSFYTVILD